MRREQILQAQRARVLEAMAEVVAERGLARTTIAAVTQRAFVSRATFIELFGSVEQCFADLVGGFMGRAAGLVCKEFEREATWRQGLLAALQELLLFLDLETALARVGLIYAWASPVAMLEHRERTVQRIAAMLDGGRHILATADQPPEITAEATVTSVAGILRARLLTGQAPPFVELLGELAAVAALPYLGPAQAAQMRSEGQGRSRSLAGHAPAKQIDGSQRQNTITNLIDRQLARPNAYVARAVLRYVAEHPGASNKGVADGVGISHLGQVSRLLARLERAGVLAKRAGGAGRPNAWTLSSHGEEVISSLRHD